MLQVVVAHGEGDVRDVLHAGHTLGDLIVARAHVEEAEMCARERALIRAQPIANAPANLLVAACEKSVDDDRPDRVDDDVDDARHHRGCGERRPATRHLHRADVLLAERLRVCVLP